MDNAANIPALYNSIRLATEAIGFGMPSDELTGSLLRTLVASKPGGRMLELGTGTGLATSWIIEGMGVSASLLSIDNNQLLIDIAQQQLPDERVQFLCTDAYQWIKDYSGPQFDLIFADAMPGKYDLFEETLQLLAPGGIYIIDDMLPQSNWPEGHDDKVSVFLKQLDERQDVLITKMSWSTGIVIVTKLTMTRQ